MTANEFEKLKFAAGQAFSPRTPVSTRELFAGRWTQMKMIANTVNQVGLHAVIFGERGVGKTSLTHIIAPLLHAMDLDHSQKIESKAEHRIVIRVNANTTDTFSSLWIKALDEIFWYEDRPTIGLQPTSKKERVSLREAFGLTDEISIDDIRRTVAVLKGSVFVFDEFDRLPKKHATAFTDLMKSLSDNAIHATIVVVGVAETVDGLMKDHASIGRALVQIPMPRMNENELAEILANAEKALSVSFVDDARTQIIRMSQGLPHVTHLIGLHSVQRAADRQSRTVTSEDVRRAFSDAVAEADQTVASAYSSAVHSAQPGAKYPQVLFAAAIAAYTHSDGFGYFQPSRLVDPMSAVLGRQEEIAGFNKHLSEFMEPKRGSVLERTGGPRAYRYRFRMPLLPPYVIMRSIKDEIVSADAVAQMLTGSE